jgi:hypothetical protein
MRLSLRGIANSRSTRQSKVGRKIAAVCRKVPCRLAASAAQLSVWSVFWSVNPWAA